MNKLNADRLKALVKWQHLPGFIIALACLLPILLMIVILKPNHPHHLPPKKYVVHKELIHKTIHFSGSIRPLKEIPVVVPVEGVIEAMPLHYGEAVKRGAVIFQVNSLELQKQYNDTLTEYLKAKDNFVIAEVKFRGTQELWKSGLLAKNNYLSEKSSLNTLHIALMQSTQKLSDLLDKMEEKKRKDLTRLSFATFADVRKALAGKHNTLLIKAKETGVLLYPPRTPDSRGELARIGGSVKAGQVLALIGDMSGVRLEIEIPETDIDKIKLGMLAHIYDLSFEQSPLSGKVVSINAQALPSGASSLPSFTAVVEARGLKPNQQQHLKVGMSVSVEITTENGLNLTVPVQAVQQLPHKTQVKVIDPAGKISWREIKTGPVFQDKVVVVSGLKPGEVILQ